MPSWKPSFADKARAELELRRRRGNGVEKKAAPRLTDFFSAAWEVIEPFTELAWNWHFDLLSEYLQAARLGQFKRLCFNLPPRMSKSNFITVAFPAHTWIDFPEARWIFGSYNYALATKHNIDRRRIVTSNFYQSEYGYSFGLSDDQNAKTAIENTKRGAMLVASPSGGAGGFGADFVIIDDIHNPMKYLTTAQKEKDLTFFDGLSSRLNDRKKGVIINVQQRVAEDDASNRCRELGYEMVVLPAVAPEAKTYSYPVTKTEKAVEQGELLQSDRLSEKDLAEEKTKNGSRFSALYLQNPLSRDGEMFKQEWFEIVGFAPAGLEWIRYYDIALSTKKTANSTACLAIGYDEKSGDVYLRDLLLGKWESPDLIDIIAQVIQAEIGAKYDTVHQIEIDGVGLSIYQNLMRRAMRIGGRIFAAPKLREAKAIRAAAWQPFAQARKIKLVNGNWIAAFISQITAFRPDIDNAEDDIVDTVSGGFAYLQRKFSEMASTAANTDAENSETSAE